MSRPGSFGGHGEGLGDLLREATRVYRSLAPVLVPPFVVAFIVLRELLVVVLAIEDLDRQPVVLLLVATFVQAIVPAFVGSLLVASALPVLAGQARRLGEGWAVLVDRRANIYRAAACSSGLALFFTVTLGPVGVILQPALLGPPLLVHEVVLQGHGLAQAWGRTKEMMAGDSRQLIYLLAIPATIGIVLATVLNAIGVLSGDVPGVVKGVLYFAVQGALLGAAMPFVAAVGVLLYEEMASALGGGEAG
ncbi:MAG: hypothetical protein ACRD0C_11065 [Acidimicrobiia bacterium]